ncbi:hypothetical protein ITP53_15285 [Nonomuraea sp. K274]|uniref:Uncharacterized protein n=1 Tax=Nonomuraea cypriaca TaxID=1187855 RepID=A0A931ABR4_9ACTN|nr:hypothetical protein [Nonomuraea cypriaca]
MAIRGGSASGWTTAVALTASDDLYAAGCSSYPSSTCPYGMAPAHTTSSPTICCRWWAIRSRTRPSSAAVRRRIVAPGCVPRC